MNKIVGLITLFLLFAFGADAAVGLGRLGVGQSRKITPSGNFNAPVTGVGVTVDMLGRLNSGNEGDTLSLQIVTNGFYGEQVASFSMVGSGQPKVNLMSPKPITIAGLQLADGTGFGDTGNQVWRFQCDGTEAYPSYAINQSIVVFGFSLMCSNWTGSENKGLDWFRVDQSPFLIVQFQAGSEIFGTLTISVHTPDGVGPTITIQNEHWYWITGIFRQTGSVEIKVYEYTSPATYTLLGTSSLTMSTGNADHIRFQQNDDHSLPSGSRYIYSTCFAIKFGDAAAYPLIPNL